MKLLTLPLPTIRALAVKSATGLLTVTVTRIDPERVGFGAAEVIDTIGRVLSTLKVVLGPAASVRLPARSQPEPASIEMPSEPSPLMLLMVTVRVAPVLLSKLSVPPAVPVVLRCTLVVDSVLDLKLASM